MQSQKNSAKNVVLRPPGQSFFQAGAVLRRGVSAENLSAVHQSAHAPIPYRGAATVPVVRPVGFDPRCRHLPRPQVRYFPDFVIYYCVHGFVNVISIFHLISGWSCEGTSSIHTSPNRDVPSSRRGPVWRPATPDVAPCSLRISWLSQGVPSSSRCQRWRYISHLITWGCGRIMAFSIFGYGLSFFHLLYIFSFPCARLPFPFVLSFPFHQREDGWVQACARKSSLIFILGKWFISSCVALLRLCETSTEQ